MLSLFCFFFSWKWAIAGITFSVGGYWIADLTENEFEVDDIGSLVDKMTREHYIQSGRIPMTFNKMEIEKLLRDVFADKLGIQENALTRDTRFV